MRVRTGGSHHQKFVVIRYRDDPSRDVAFVGGMDLAHNRRDDADHGGDPQPQPLTEEYGAAPALARRPGGDPRTRRLRRGDGLPGAVGRPDPAVAGARGAAWPTGSRGLDTSARPAARAAAAPPEAGAPRRPAAAHLSRPAARPRLPVRPRRASAASPAATARRWPARERMVYVEDQYFWGHDIAAVFAAALRDAPELRLVVVMPLVPDIAGLNRVPAVPRPGRALES